MERMLAEELTRVNEGDSTAEVCGNVTSRWQGTKIGRGVLEDIAETVCESIERETDGGEIGLPAPRVL